MKVDLYGLRIGGQLMQSFIIFFSCTSFLVLNNEIS